MFPNNQEVFNAIEPSLTWCFEHTAAFIVLLLVLLVVYTVLRFIAGPLHRELESRESDEYKSPPKMPKVRKPRTERPQRPKGQQGDIPECWDRPDCPLPPDKVEKLIAKRNARRNK